MATQHHVISSTECIELSHLIDIVCDCACMKDAEAMDNEEDEANFAGEDAKQPEDTCVFFLHLLLLPVLVKIE